MHACCPQAQELSKTFHRRLVWRDLAYWQLHHWPRMATEPIRQHYIDLEWNWGPEARHLLRAWQRGQTGFPLVDAGGGWGAAYFCFKAWLRKQALRLWSVVAALMSTGRLVQGFCQATA
jgi:hypothetical protein